MALDPARTIDEKPFRERLCERFQRNEIPAELRTISKKQPTAVVLLDLATEQLSESASAPVSTVLYWKTLQWAEISKIRQIAELELRLIKLDKYDEFKERHEEHFNNSWLEIHNDTLIAPRNAGKIASIVIPELFPSINAFRDWLKIDEVKTVRDIAQEIIDVCRWKTGYENILLMIDEAGQYVATRGELILNLQGLSQNLKELGKGKVWIAATGQQTLTEIVEKAAHNSSELNKLMARFPISINLDASDIREITHRRLLEKSDNGLIRLEALFKADGQATLTHTRLSGTKLFTGDSDSKTFSRLYPFLPQHFDLLLELIRTLARSTGGIGLRSAIRVIQDVLVDKSRVLGEDAVKLADRGIGCLACVDDFYDTLKADISKVLPHVIGGVEKTKKIFGVDAFEVRVAKAVAALQPVETFPRTAENIAALLYRTIGSPGLLDQVKESLRKLSVEKECGLIEDPQAGWVFLSDAVKPIRDKRNSYSPTSGECARARIDVLKQGTADHAMFRVQPSARIENIKEVRAAVKLGRTSVVGGADDVEVRLEFTEPSLWDERLKEFLISTNSQVELKNTVVMLIRNEEAVEELLSEIVKSEKVLGDVDERGADHVVAQYLRAERRSAERSRERAAAAMEKTMMDGVFIFRGKPTPVREAGESLDSALRGILSKAVKEVFPHYHLAPIRPSTDAAAKFLGVERMDRITKDFDPLGLVTKSRGAPRIDTAAPVLAEVLRVFQAKFADSGSGRLQGSYLQDVFSSPPYGWTKDTVRYLFAALLRAGDIEFHVPGAEGAVRTAGPKAVEGVKSTVAFNRIGVSPRDGKLPPEALDRAARRLETLFGDEVLPLEDHISRSVRRNIPDLLEKLGALPDRLRLLELPGEDRVRRLLADAADLLKSDAGGAGAVLGGVECSLPDEITWAKAVFEALECGAEEDVRNARIFLNSTADLERLFPGSTTDILGTEDRETAEDVLSSDRFHERLPELREVVRGVVDRAESRYADERTTYEESLKKALNDLEADPDWTKLLDEDREEIATKLSCDMPETAEDGDPVTQLQTLLVRKRTLAGLIADLREEVKKRRAAEPEPEPVPGERESVEPAEEEVVEADDLVQTTVIASSAELESWLASLRKKLTDLLKSNKRIRIKGHE
jgi:hypothetical protein